MQAQLKMHETIKANLDSTAAISKEYFDRKARKRDFAVNDLVLLTNTRKANKIQPDFVGPFLITDASRAAENIVTIDSIDGPGRPTANSFNDTIETVHPASNKRSAQTRNRWTAPASHFRLPIVCSEIFFFCDTVLIPPSCT
uniref:Uncharacterized protein n=1 Tax=Romanomermis culicivorax TaxID=13658 RepID=A0A915KIX2_ROMCU